jgi:hypothetical protein
MPPKPKKSKPEMTREANENYKTLFEPGEVATMSVSAGLSRIKDALAVPPEPEQLAEAKRLRTKLDEHNPELAEKLWSEHANPYTSEQYQTLISALAAEVQSAEGGPA